MDKCWEVMLPTEILGWILGCVSHFRGVNSKENLAVEQDTNNP